MDFIEFIADKPLLTALAVLLMTIAAFYIFTPIGEKRKIRPQ